MQVALAALEIAHLLRLIPGSSSALDAWHIVEFAADADALGQVVGWDCVVSPSGWNAWSRCWVPISPVRWWKVGLVKDVATNIVHVSVLFLDNRFGLGGRLARHPFWATRRVPWSMERCRTEALQPTRPGDFHLRACQHREVAFGVLLTEGAAFLLGHASAFAWRGIRPATKVGVSDPCTVFGFSWGGKALGDAAWDVACEDAGVDRPGVAGPQGPLGVIVSFATCVGVNQHVVLAAVLEDPLHCLTVVTSGDEKAVLARREGARRIVIHLKGTHVCRWGLEHAEGGVTAT